MSKKQLLYAAFDTGPSNYGLDIIAHAQRKKNWGVMYFGNNSGAGRDVAWNMEFDYAVVGGPSSFENAIDREILDYCLDHNKPIFVLGDSPRSILRSGIKGYVDHATAIVAVPSDVDLARQFGYKDAVWLEGYPSHWGNPNTTPVSDIFQHGPYAAPAGCAKIFVCGLKHAKITDVMLGAVLSGMDKRGMDYRAYFQSHPSEIEATKDHVRRARLLEHANVRELKTRENVASVMRASDVTVCTGGATAIIEGALLQLPVVYYLDTLVRNYMKRQTNEEVWGPVDAGSCVVASRTDIAMQLDRLLDTSSIGSSWRGLLHADQVAAFPPQAPGLNICQEVLDYIENPNTYVPLSQRQKK